MSKNKYFKNTEGRERKSPIGSTAVKQALEEQQAVNEDALIANAKSIYQQVSPPNDNSQLNAYLYPPYTTDKKDKA